MSPSQKISSIKVVVRRSSGKESSNLKIVVRNLRIKEILQCCQPKSANKISNGYLTANFILIAKFPDPYDGVQYGNFHLVPLFCFNGAGNRKNFLYNGVRHRRTVGKIQGKG